MAGSPKYSDVEIAAIVLEFPPKPGLRTLDRLLSAENAIDVLERENMQLRRDLKINRSDLVCAGVVGGMALFASMQWIVS
jgi:hypothetical protein